MAEVDRDRRARATAIFKLAVKASSAGIHRTVNRPPKGKGWVQGVNCPTGLMCRPAKVRESIELFAKAYEEFPDIVALTRWNSTVTGIEGEIREGERLRLHVPGMKRTLTPRVLGVVPARRMVWSDGVALVFRGVRTFVLTPRGDASTDFVMEERFSGRSLPLPSVYCRISGRFSRPTPTI